VESKAVSRGVHRSKALVTGGKAVLVKAGLIVEETEEMETKTMVGTVTVNKRPKIRIHPRPVPSPSLNPSNDPGVAVTPSLGQAFLLAPLTFNLCHVHHHPTLAL
jgi:hypothetical protein